MVEVGIQIVMAAIISLTIICITAIICGHDSQAILYAIVGCIGMLGGVIIPTPKVDNKRGVLKW